MQFPPRYSAIARALVLSCSLAIVTGCLSSSRVAEMGDEEADKVEQTMGLVKDPKLVAYVNAVGRRLVAQSDRPDTTWTFQVVATAEPNAFALPGGHIYVSRGLLALVNSEDELAGVIGHEIGHVTADHSTKRINASVATSPIAIATGIAGAAVGIVSPALGNVVGGTGQLLQTGLVVAPFSRSQENEADEIGQTLAAQAGYAPPALANFLHTLDRDDKLQRGKERNQNIMDYHPMTPDRVAKLSERAGTLRAGPSRPVARDRADLLARLDGIIVGKDPAEGVFEENVFLHPVFDVSVTFPTAWETANTPEAAGAVNPAQDAVSMISIASNDSNLAKLLEEVRSSDPDLEIQRLEINGLPAAQTRVTGRGRYAHVTLIEHKGLVFSIVGRSSQSQAQKYANAFDATARSFRTLSTRERNSIKESRLRSRHATAGETAAAIAKRTASSWSAAQIAVANGFDKDQALAADELLKVAVPQPFEQGNR